MGCMEHWCVSCDWFTVNNEPGEMTCPECGSRCSRHCDESPEPREWDGDYADEEPDE